MYYQSTWACDVNSERFVTETHSRVTLQTVPVSGLWCIYISLCCAEIDSFFRRILSATFCAVGSQYSNGWWLLQDNLQVNVLLKVGMYERMILGVEMEQMK
jgi:hypothetical protein